MSRAFRTHPKHPAVAHLVRLHADLSGQIDASRKEAKRLADARAHVEAVIKMFDPAYNVNRIPGRRHYRRNKWFKRGTMMRAVFEVLKRADGPLTARQVVDEILAERGVTDAARADIHILDSAVRSCFQKRENREVVRIGDGMPAKWRLAGGDV